MPPIEPKGALPRFIVLYATLYAAFGVASPFLPAFVGARGLPPEQLGLALGAGMAVRLVTAPLAGRIGDLIGSLRVVLVLCLALAAFATLGYLWARGFWIFLAVILLHAASLAPVSVLADALTLGRRFEYGWVRGTGSAAFIAGTLLSGQAVGAWSLDVIVPLQSLLLGATAFAAYFLPELARVRSADTARVPMEGFLVLFKIPFFRNLVLVAALILGSHAMHDAFAVIRWTAAGLSPSTASFLWSEAVAAEVLVFFVIGPALVTRLTPAGAIAVSAAAGVLRWAVMAQTADVTALALVQPLHGLTFALLHLSCMRLIARTVPPGLEGTGQALYATVGVGTATTLLTVASGALYARLGAQGFWIMAALCALALPLTWKLLKSGRRRY
jgi:PPP family 3-phenylpropionic acid transporter